MVASPRLLVASIALGLLAACDPSLHRQYRSNEEQWQRTQREQASPDDSEIFRGVAELDREALVRAVLRRNPGVRAAHYAWRAAFARFPQESALDDPELGFGVAPFSFGSSRVNDAYKVELSQKLPFPGKLSLKGELALAEADAARNDFEATQLRLALMASLLFDELYFLDRALEINAEHIELLEEFLRIATTRYEAGKAAQQDPIQAEVVLTHAIHREVVLTTERRITREQVNVLLHRRPDLPLPSAPSYLDLPEAPNEDVERLTALALAARPELRAADARTRSRASAVALAWREYFPDLTLVGAYNTLWQEQDLQPFVGLRVNVPLQLPRRRGAVDEAEAHLEHAKSDRASLDDEVRYGVSSSILKLEEARHVMNLFRDRIVPASQDQVAAARSGYESGRNSFLTLIDAELTLRDAQLEYEKARTDVSRRFAELQRAIGKLPLPDHKNPDYSNEADR